MRAQEAGIPVLIRILFLTRYDLHINQNLVFGLCLSLRRIPAWEGDVVDRGGRQRRVAVVVILDGRDQKHNDVLAEESAEFYILPLG